MNHLNVKALALSFGIVWGLLWFCITLIAMFTGYGAEMIEFFESLFPFVSVSLPGAFIMLVGGFLDGVIAGGLVAWLYNKFAQ